MIAYSRRRYPTRVVSCVKHSKGEKLIQSTDQTIHFRKEGSGAPVLILHGLFGSANNWQTIARKLSESYSVFSLDMRNHGKSFHDDQFDYDVMADDVMHLIRQQGLNEVSLIGHSMGGKVAMKFAACNPDFVRKLIVVDISHKAYTDLHQDLIEALYQLDISQISRLKDADEMLKEAIPDRDMRLFLISNLKRKDNGRYHWQINIKGIRKNHQNLLEEVTGKPLMKPCLFIRGGNSEYIRDSDWPEILNLFPSAELVTVHGAGHWVHIEGQDKFQDAVLTFLEE